jgi:hypothetical protein
MRKSAGTRRVWFVLWAIVAAIVAIDNVRGFMPDSDHYTPTCDGKYMQAGDSCLTSTGTGGGSYDQMVNDHLHNEQILFVVSCPLTILFTGLAIRGPKRRRQVSKAS